MIKLTKLAEPEILTSKKTEWTRQYVELLTIEQPIPESLKHRYRDPQIKQRIKDETHDKCIYCESKVTHVYPGDVEHIIPKSKKPELIFEWSNLTFACQECNRNKSDYYEPSLQLINPYSDEPKEHLKFVGPMIFHTPGSERGRLTRKVLELNRTPLIERRVERLENITNLMELYRNCDEGPGKEALLIELKREAFEDKEYSYMIETFLQQSDID